LDLPLVVDLKRRRRLNGKRCVLLDSQLPAEAPGFVNIERPLDTGWHQGRPQADSSRWNKETTADTCGNLCYHAAIRVQRDCILRQILEINFDGLE